MVGAAAGGGAVSSGPASAAMLLVISMLARIDVARRTRMGQLVLRLCLFAGKWAARSACSIKYAFIVLTPMKSHFDATWVTQLRALLLFNNTFN
jgi:hypothetical protein